MEEIPSLFEEVARDQSTSIRYWEVVQFPHGKDGRFDKSCSNRVASVSRPYLGDSILVIEALSCAIPAVQFESTPAAGDDSSKWWESMTQWGWEIPIANGVTSLPGVPSALAWSVEPTSAGETSRYLLELTVLTGSTDTVVVSPTVNGVDLEEIVLPSGRTSELVFDVPAPTIQGAPDNLVVVEFVLSDTNGAPVTNKLMVSMIRPAV
jgi:hypothetical protein